MNRLSYFLAAMKAETYRRRPWVFTAFSIVQEGPEDWKKDPYPYRLVQTPTGLFFVDPAKNLELTVIEDARPGEAPFERKERIQLSGPEDCPNLTKPVETTYGNLLANYMVVVYPFGKKIPYLEGRFSPSTLENIILPLLKDANDPTASQAGGTQRDPKWIYVDEYVKFVDAMFFLASFASLFVPAGTKKSLMPPPGVVEYRNQLFLENKDRLDDPEVLANIAKKLQDYDMAWLKGDETLDFLITKKSLEVVRAKKFLMHGAEAGLSDGVKRDLIPNSLYEGWDISKFPAMNNALRAGSYNRGAETMLGGEEVKWLLRASSNINILPGDCGSSLGVPVWMDDKKLKKYMGFSIVVSGATIVDVNPDGSYTLSEGETTSMVINEETAPQILNKRVLVRSPLYCWKPMTDYCECCVGPRLAASPTGASSAITEYGSTMMLISMKAMHGKALKTARMNYKEALT